MPARLVLDAAKACRQILRTLAAGRPAVAATAHRPAEHSAAAARR
jgi:hypothetical protein